MSTVYVALAVITTLVWLPIVIKFYKSWMVRRNPISLAICCVFILSAWQAVAQAWVFFGSLDAAIVMFATTGMSFVTGLSTHLAFYWSDKKFPEQRSSTKD